MGKLINVIGPSFSGKTRLMTNLLRDFPNVDTVQYELFWNGRKHIDKCYQEFFQDIDTRLEESDVISESTGFKLLSGANRGTMPLNIVVWPGMDRHMMNFQTYLKEHGTRVTVLRTGGNGVYQMRKHFADNFYRHGKINVHKYDGEDYDSLKLRVEDFFKTGSVELHGKEILCSQTGMYL